MGAYRPVLLTLIIKIFIYLLQVIYKYFAGNPVKVFLNTLPVFFFMYYINIQIACRMLVTPYYATPCNYSCSPVMSIYPGDSFPESNMILVIHKIYSGIIKCREVLNSRR